ncbi:NACHT domain-containing protein [Mycena sanguinolenta]|uniref:NACHT domain-containing protein n=1 Tax=Mycena sanguinolenta TaxID=230812 RepID=A0A8H7CR59_9AGAR|nr:NACHT domain-containing protein [Mycena sanguinolenta]
MRQPRCTAQALLHFYFYLTLNTFPRSLTQLKLTFTLNFTSKAMFSEDTDHSRITIIVHAGGAGGQGHGNGTGGAGGPGMGPTLNFHPGKRGIDILHAAVASAAIHHSRESFAEPRCHPETRMKMLQDLRNWAQDMTRPNILWLHGPAGAGKSAIMKTLAVELADAGKLGASFFFKRDDAMRGNANALFTTITYQLALNISWLKIPISQIVENDPSILWQTPETQFRKLILEIGCTDKNQVPIPIIIDGLDECQGPEIQKEILRVIRNSCSESSIPLRFIIASRPEPHISMMFNSQLHDSGYASMNVEQSFDDVRKYLSDEFARIHNQHEAMKEVPSPWPYPDVLEELVRKSSGYFIYAATIVKFIGDENHHPTQRLAIIQDGISSKYGSAFGPLDQLYITILGFTPRQSELTPILCAIANFDLSVRKIDWALGFADGDTRLVLRGLHSVLKVPSDDETWYISTWHASFKDFLNDPHRSQNFYIGGSQCRMDLARSFLKLFAGPYRRQVFKDPLVLYGENRMPLRTLRGNFMSFLISLSPTPELCSLIHHMNPDNIFSLGCDFSVIVSWLKKMRCAPYELITLWEDYAYMASLRDVTMQMPNIQRPVSYNPEQLRVLVAVFSTGWMGLTLRHIPLLFEITWSELRAKICGLRSSPVDKKIILRSINSLLDRSKVYQRQSLCRDLARQFIRLHHVADPNSESEIDALDETIAYLVRSSSPSPELYRDLKTTFPQICGAPGGNGSFKYHVSKWLDSFSYRPDGLVRFVHDPANKEVTGSPEAWEGDW